MKINLGTHNSMTYLPLKKWYLYPFRFIAKCQSKTIEEQYNKYKVRVFDLRVSYDKKGNLEFRHGLMAFKGDVEATLRYLNSRKAKVYVRLLLEVSNSISATKKQEEQFIEDCKRFETEYSNITFFCGRRKYDWKELYHFKYKEPDITQYVSSMQGNKIDDLWPWLYARLNNKKNMSNNTNKWVLYDFIEIQ